MISVIAFEQWKELFDNELSNIWNQEINKELKTLSMLLFCVKREMNKITHNLDKDFLKISEKVTSNNEKNSSSKNNIEPDQNKIDSSSSSLSSLVVLSDDDILHSGPSKSKLINSPELKRKKKHPIFSEHKIKFGEATKQFEKLAASNSCTIKRSPKKKKSPKTPIKKINFRPLTEYLNHNKTPLKKKENLGSPMVIGCTPDSYVSKKSQASMKPKLFSQVSINDSNDMAEMCSNSELKDLSCDETFLEEPHNKLESEMSINEIVNYINNSEAKADDAVKHSAKHTKRNFPDESMQLLLPTSKTNLNNDNKKNNGNCHQALNDFLAEARKSAAAPTIASNAVVRGNARKNLPGWACQECEKFYVNQGLTRDEILQLNKCSRHRGFIPRENTPEGYWDMTIDTEELKKMP